MGGVKCSKGKRKNRARFGRKAGRGVGAGQEEEQPDRRKAEHRRRAFLS